MDVKLPDGTVIHNVPEGTSKADLVSKLQANGYDTSWYKPDEAPKPVTDKNAPVAPDEATNENQLSAIDAEGFYAQSSEPEFNASPALKRIGTGVADPIVGAAQLLTNVSERNFLRPLRSIETSLGIPQKYQPANLAAPLNQYIARAEEAYQHSRGEEAGTLDLLRIVGNLANPLGWYGLGPASKATSFLSRFAQDIGKGAGLGATQSTMLTPATLPEEEKGYFEQKTEQAVHGAAAGGGLAALGKLVAPFIRPAIEKLQSMGVTPTLGQLLGGPALTTETKMMSSPLVGDAIKNARGRVNAQANRGVLNRALDRANAPRIPDKNLAGNEMLQHTADALGQRYDDTYRKLTLTMTPGIDTDVQTLINNTVRSLSGPNARKYKRVVDEAVYDRLKVTNLTQPKRAVGDDLQGIITDLKEEARAFSSEPNRDAQKMAKGLTAIKDKLHNALLLQNPAHRGELKRIDRSYAEYMRAQQAGSRLGSDEGVWSPSQLLSASRALDKSANKRQFAHGKALMQKEANEFIDTLGATLPNSHSADRLGAMMLLLDPKKYLPYLAYAGAYTRPGQSAIGGLMTGGMGWRRPLAESIGPAAGLSVLRAQEQNYEAE